MEPQSWGENSCLSGVKTPIHFGFGVVWLEPLSAQKRTSLVAQTVKRLSTMRETWVRSLGWEDPLEMEMAIHSRTIAWKIPWTEEPGRLQPMGSQRVGHDWAISLTAQKKHLKFFNVPPFTFYNTYTRIHPPTLHFPYLENWYSSSHLGISSMYLGQPFSMSWL